MTLNQAIKFLGKLIPNPSLGLPEKVFLFISRITPLISVDLLVKDEHDRILLSWRDDQFYGQGWHTPGGIVRFKESLEERIKRVAETEMGTMVKFDPTPVAINQVFHQGKIRGHFISFLYNCFLSSKFVPKNKGLKKTDSGYLQWHRTWPKNLIDIQKELYKDITL